MNKRKRSDSSIGIDFNETPIRRRGRGTSTICYDIPSIESEFNRIYTNSPIKDITLDDNISFLFRGATKDISTSTVGMYGEINLKSLSNICNVMKDYGLDEKSIVLDLGSGRGIPNILFSRNANIFSSIGIEKCPLAYLGSINNIYTLLSRDISKIKSDFYTQTPLKYKDDYDENSSINSVSTQIIDDSSPNFNEYDNTPDIYNTTFNKNIIYIKNLMIFIQTQNSYPMMAFHLRSNPTLLLLQRALHLRLQPLIPLAVVALLIIHL